ncbi:hypothetical protein JTB14_000628 [Gonioctena quinquepunctata]|nr:hypothetical protein JTB14_000628 [Gonioctena quinquepunctata]
MPSQETIEKNENTQPYKVGRGQNKLALEEDYLIVLDVNAGTNQLKTVRISFVECENNEDDQGFIRSIARKQKQGESATGSTIWEHTTAKPFHCGHNED